MSSSRQFGLLTAHCVIYQASTATAGGFIGAYLLSNGFSVAAALVAYAALLTLRFGMRLAVLPVVARIGMRAALVLGVAIDALQFVPLLHIGANQAWLGAWVFTTSLAEALYWPVLHAASAVTGASGSRGRDVARRQAFGAVVAVACPVLGGWILGRFGPEADFALAGGLFLLSALPVLLMGRFAAGPVPSIAQSFRSVDRVGMAAFAADGWIQSGLVLAWPMILFATFGSHYEALGLTSAVAALAGAGAGVVCGAGIDRGQRGAYLRVVSLALVTACVLRACADAGGPWVAQLGNAVGAAVAGLYTPVIMSVIYERSRRSGSAYRFHIAAEAGWDVGAVGGCLAAATAAWFGGPSLAMVPAILGIGVMHACVQAEGKEATGTPASADRLSWLRRARAA